MIHIFTFYLIRILIFQNSSNWSTLVCEWFLNTNNSLLINITYLSVPVPAGILLYNSIDNDPLNIVDDSNPELTTAMDYSGPQMKITFASLGVPLGLVCVGLTPQYC